MPTIYLKNLDLCIESNRGRTLLINFLNQDAPIHTVCGGHANCGCCRVKILSGAEGMNKPNNRERHRLGDELVEQGWRLSCQAYALRDITVYLPGSDELDAKCSRHKKIGGA